MKDKVKPEDQLKYYMGGYHGVSLMDEYPLKEYILKEIEIVMKNLKEENEIELQEYEKINEEAKKLSDKTKLQDALLILNDMNAPMDLVFMIKEKLKSYIKKA